MRASTLGLLVLLIGSGAGPATAGELTQVPGSRVALALPPGFVRVARTHSFANDRQDVVTVVNFTVPAGHSTELMAGVEDAAAAWRELTRVSFKLDGGAEAVMLAGRTDQGAVRMAILRKATAVAMVEVLCRTAACEASSERLVRSAKLEPDVALDAALIMGVELGPAEGLEVRPIMSNVLTFEEPGAKIPIPPGSASFRLLYAPTGDAPMDRGQLIQAIGLLIASVRPDMGKAEVSSLDLDGMSGVELVTRGEDDGTVLIVYGAALKEPGGVFVMTATVAATQTLFLKRFKTLARSLRRR